MLKNLPIITCILLGISLLVALLSGMGRSLEVVHVLLFSSYTNAPPFYDIRNGEYWRVFTPVFLHFGLMHLAFNGAMLWMLGNVMEKVHSAWSFLLIVVIIAVSSNIAQYLVSGPLFGGLSGVLYGLFAFVWLQHRMNRYYPLMIPDQMAKALIIWFLICLSGVLKFVGIHVANTAHFSGIVAGCLCSVVYYFMVRRPSDKGQGTAF